MIFISAQTDDAYYKWQLEIQLFNFKSLDIPAENIHVLVAYKDELNPHFLDLISKFKDYATFFIYRDTRTSKCYLSSIRPHIIKKHFLKHPKLDNEVLFYHDCDIIFRCLPNITRLSEGRTWYVSDTKTYLGVDYIKSKGEFVFSDMCRTIGISEEKVMQNDDSSGGAQYILKNVNFQFWEKVEQDCEKLYTLFSSNYERYRNLYSLKSGKPEESYHEIQRWCADMWALLWNGFMFNYTIKVDSDLDFCWPMDNISRWEETKILHNAGVDKKESSQYFYKGDFEKELPYGHTFDYVNKKSCSYIYVEQIRKLIKANIL